MSYLGKGKVSFEGLFDFTDKIEVMVLKLRQYNDGVSFAQEMMLCDVLVHYYECLKKSNRLKTQREHCRVKMEKLFPAFCKGYFKR